MFNPLAKSCLGMSVSIGIVCLFSRFFGVSPVWSAGIDMGIGLGISDFLKQSLATREQKSYLNQVYASNFSMDPFKVAMNNAQGQGNELLLGGIQSIVLQLQKKSCSLAQTDIALILAYAHKPFKSTTTYQIFSGTVLESTTIETEEARKACDRFNQCYYAPDAFKGDMMTDCQTKFVSRYTGGYSQTERIQGVQMAQAGSDKYWNSSLKDSPYDLMYDMSAVSKVLFENIQEPVEVVFYHLPEFSNQGNAGGGSSPSGSRPSSRSSTRSTTASTTSSLGTGVVLPGTFSGSVYGVLSGMGTTFSGMFTGSIMHTGISAVSFSLLTGMLPAPFVGTFTGRITTGSLLFTGKFSGVFTGFGTDVTGMLLGTLTGTVYGNVQGNQLSLLWSFASSFTTPVLEKEDLSSSDPSSEGDVGETAPTVVDTEFSNFLQGTPSYTSESTLFGGNICRGTGEEIDLPETTSLGGGAPETPYGEDISDEDLQEYAEYVVDAINSYGGGDNNNDTGNNNDDDPSGPPLTVPDTSSLASAVEQVKGCIASKCSGLSVDKKAACIAMCACGQVDSPLFNPEKYPGMNPILSIKFCTVPVSAKDFSPGGTIVYSIEEVFNQWYGVMDTLEKGGELGVHEKQKEFLDSSTKGMNFGKMVTFTFDQAVKSSPPSSPSKYIAEQGAKNIDTNVKQVLGVSQPLDNPVSRDGYLLIQNPMNMVNTYATTQNYANEAKKVEDLQQSLTALSDVKETSRNEKDILIGNEIEVFLDQHHKFWLTVEMVLKQIISVANQLFMNR